MTDEHRRSAGIDRTDGPAEGPGRPAGGSAGPAGDPTRPADGPVGPPADGAEQAQGDAGRVAAVPAGTGASGRVRRRRLIVAGVIAGAVVLVLAICAGLAAVLSAVDDFSERTRGGREARDARLLTDAACLELENRLNRVAPPGSTTSPAGRAGAIRNENTALRPYLTELQLRERGGVTRLDLWRQLLDARTAYAEALDRSAQTRTPAFFVVPRTRDGQAVADQLAGWSSAACGGPVRRLAAPDL